MARYIEHGRLIHDSEGRRLLRIYLESHSQADLARYLAVSRSDVSRWLSGKNQPTTALILLRLQLIGIPIESWCNPPIVHPCNTESTKVNESPAVAAQ